MFLLCGERDGQITKSKKEIEGMKRYFCLILLITIMMLQGCRNDTYIDTQATGTKPIGTTVSDILNAEEKTITVWIPKTGIKYHKRSFCSNMKNPSAVTKQEAIKRGFTSCKKCW